MKYFGKRSLSSVMSTVLNVSWYLSIVACILAPFFSTFIIFYSTPTGESFMMSAAKEYRQDRSQDPMTDIQIEKKMCHDQSDTDKKDWIMFKKLPLPVKLMILPYICGIMILLLFIIKQSRLLFANFKNDIVFNLSNVKLISHLSKLLIAFSIVVFSFSTLLVSIVLLLLCEIIKDGTVLKEEMDLTI